MELNGVDWNGGKCEGKECTGVQRVECRRVVLN